MNTPTLPAPGTPAAGAFSDALRRARPVWLPLVAGVVGLVAWTAAVRGFGVSPIILPAPDAIWNALVSGLPLLQEHLRQTAAEAAVGLLLSSVLGLAVAFALALSPLLLRAVFPNLILVQMVPKVAMAPLFIIWIGVGIETRMAFAAFLAFFPIVVAATTGLTHTDPGLLRLCRACSASPWQVFVSVRLPSALPHIFAGLKIGATMTMIGLIVGEFVTAQSGLGYMTMYAAAALETAFMLAAIVLICVIGASLYVFMTVLETLVRRRFGA